VGKVVVPLHGSGQETVRRILLELMQASLEETVAGRQFNTHYLNEHRKSGA